MSKQDSFNKATEATKKAGFRLATQNVVDLAAEFRKRGVLSDDGSGLEK